MSSKDNFMLCGSEDFKEDLLEEYKEKWGNVIIQGKLDGIRAMFIKGRLVNRRGNDLTKKYNHIKIDNDCVLDGEIVIFSDEKKLKTDFNKVRTKEHYGKAIFVVFDVLQYEGEMLVEKPLLERYDYLKNIKGEFIVKVDELNTPKWNEVIELGLEGWVLKNPKSVYEFARSKDWIKVKAIKQKDLIFTKYTEHNKGLRVETDDEVAITINGSQSQEVKDILDKEGKVVIEVNYLEVTENGRLRQPTFSKVKKQDFRDIEDIEFYFLKKVVINSLSEKDITFLNFIKRFGGMDISFVCSKVDDGINNYVLLDLGGQKGIVENNSLEFNLFDIVIYDAEEKIFKLNLTDDEKGYLLNNFKDLKKPYYEIDYSFNFEDFLNFETIKKIFETLINKDVCFKGIIKFKDNDNNVKIHNINFKNKLEINKIPIRKGKELFLIKTLFEIPMISNKKIELINKKSGILVGVLSMGKIILTDSYRENKLEIPISIDYIKDKLLSVKIFNIEKEVEWETMKYFFVSGRNVSNKMNYGTFKRFMFKLEIDEETYLNGLRTEKVFSKLKEKNN